MNRFADLLEALKSRPQDDSFMRLIEGVERNSVPAGDREPSLKLPYSSNPKPIEEPWA
jgi:hypothetical protein